jgi:hypothetical protein
VTIADRISQKRVENEDDVKRLRVLAQLWSLSRPGVLLLSGWLGKRAALLLPGAFAGALPEALLVALVVFLLFVAWERLGYHLGESPKLGRATGRVED